MTACLAAATLLLSSRNMPSPATIQPMTHSLLCTGHGGSTPIRSTHPVHKPCRPPPIEAIPLIQQQPAIRIEYLPVRMTHSEEEKGDGQEATHTHSTTRAATASENPNTGGGGGEVEETQARETTRHRPQRQRNRRRPHSTRPIHTRSASQPVSQSASQ